jgi:hypothetical protein
VIRQSGEQRDQPRGIVSRRRIAQDQGFDAPRLDPRIVQSLEKDGTRQVLESSVAVQAAEPAYR